VSFWVLFYVFSSPSLLADLRNEVQNHLLQHNNHEDADCIKAQEDYLDVSRIQSNCPLLMSTWNEVLRIVTLTATTNRCVLADTYIGDQILLKKGGIIQIPTGAFHSDHNIWGSNVNEFDPRRFLSSKQVHRSAAFRPFGGGSTMRPGRYLAVTEILGFVSAVILGFEISLAESEWKLPKKDSRPFPWTVKPASDIKVVIRMRVGFEKTVWSFKRFDV
jgi:cytochrome P450